MTSSFDQIVQLRGGMDLFPTYPCESTHSVYFSAISGKDSHVPVMVFTPADIGPLPDGVIARVVGSARIDHQALLVTAQSVIVLDADDPRHCGALPVGVTKDALPEDAQLDAKDVYYDHSGGEAEIVGVHVCGNTSQDLKLGSRDNCDCAKVVPVQLYYTENV